MYADDGDNVKNKKMGIFAKIFIILSILFVMLTIVVGGYRQYLEYSAKITAKEEAFRAAKLEEERLVNESKEKERQNYEYTQNLNWVEVSLPNAKSLEEDGWEFYRLKHDDMFYSYYKKDQHSFIYVAFRATSASGKKYEIDFEEKSIGKDAGYGDVTLHMITANDRKKKSAVCEMNNEKWRMSANMTLDFEIMEKITKMMPSASHVTCVVDGEKVIFNINDWRIFKFNEFSIHKGL